MSRLTGTGRSLLAVTVLTLCATVVPGFVGSSASAGTTLADATQIVTLPAPIVSVYGNSSDTYPGPEAGGTGPAAGVAAVRTACNADKPLSDAQWYALPAGDLDAAWVVQSGSYRDDPDKVPARFAFVNANTLTVVSCSDGPTEVSGSTPLLLAAWFPAPKAQCDPEGWEVCGQQFLNATLHRVSRQTPANDDWQNAATIGSLPFTKTVDTSRATLDGPRRADWSRCLPSAVNQTETADVWFEYTAPADGTLKLAVGSPVPGYTPMIGITPKLSGNGGPQAPDPDAELDDCFPPATVAKGKTYLISVLNVFDSFYGEAFPVGGPVTVSVTLDGAAAQLGPARAVRVTQDGAAAATLRWTPPAEGFAADITGYRLRRDGAGAQTVTLGAGETAFTFTGLSPWQPYTFSVETLRGSQAGPKSTTVAYLSGNRPSTPLTVNASSGNAKATLSWKAPTHDGTSAVTGYRLRRYAAADNALQQTVTVPAGTTSYTFGSLTNGTGHRFDVTALNGSGAGTPSARTSVVTPAGGPSVPVNVVAARDAVAKTARLTWAPPAQDGGSAVSGYVVTRDGQDAKGNGPVTRTAGGDARSALFTDLVPGTKYRFTVAAINATATGPASLVVITLTAP